ncbi:hypothetical protein Lal_00037528 [Lupinus albus]|nr:hypothetical protein Lal_00037528 [Lupinus albus]
MTRGNTGHLHPINPEIDRTYHRLDRQSRNLTFHSVTDSVSDSDSIFDSIPVSVHSVQYTDFVHSVALSDSEHSENSMHSENMAQPPTPPGPRERTLRELAAPDFTYDSLCIQYPNEDVPYVLKTGLIHLLPKFNGLAGEDPHKHLKEFHIVCSTMKPHDLYYLAPGSITSWGDLKRTFLGKFFPASRTTAIRKDISGIRQQHGESLSEYWERFKRLCASCPHHQISEQLLLQYFNEGLNNMDMSIIDAASGGAFGDMTPFEARGLIEKMASNSQQFNARSSVAIIVRGVHDVGTDSKQVINNPPPVPSELSLEELVSQMTMQNMQFQQETRASIQRQESSIQNMTTQMGQMATSLNTLQSQNSDKLPSQTVINPKNVSAITLRSGKQTELATS